MHKYNFDENIDRRNTNSYKWDTVDSDVLPLWVADMDFKTSPVIIDAVTKVAQMGVYGYACTPNEYYDAIINFHKRHYNEDLKKEWIYQSPTLISAITAILQALTLPGYQVITQTPAYNCFFSCIRNSGCEIVNNPLLYKNGKFTIDFELLEKQASHERARVLLLCNPHNPTGRLWTKNELSKIIEIAKPHNLIVISDEVHRGIKPNGSTFNPIINIDKDFNDLIVLHSASKTFNTAGLQNAYLYTKNKEYLNRIDRQMNINEHVDLNPFGIAATIAAFNDSDEWMAQLNDYIQDNFKILKEFFNNNYPNIKVIDLESTYLAWIDCSSLNMSAVDIQEKLLNEGKLYINDGDMYGSPNPSFIRINLGCTKANLIEALNRFKKVFK